MAMQIHVLSEIPSDSERRERMVIDELLDRQRGKFIISKEREARLFLFPFWCKHAEIMRRQIEDLGIYDFHGAGIVQVLKASHPIDPAYVGMVYDSETMRNTYNRDRPSDEDFARQLIDEGERLIAAVLTSIQKRRDDNDDWDARRKTRSA